MNANKLLLAHASHEIRTDYPYSPASWNDDDAGKSVWQTIQDKVQKRADAINRDLTGLNDLVESICSSVVWMPVMR